MGAGVAVALTKEPDWEGVLLCDAAGRVDWEGIGGLLAEAETATEGTFVPDAEGAGDLLDVLE